MTQYFHIALLILAAAVPTLYGNEAAADKAADEDQTPLTSFGVAEMAKLRVDALSFTEEVAVCKRMRAALGRFPSVALARGLAKAIVVMQMNGSKDKPDSLAYQMMQIAEARGQLKDDKAIYKTFDTVTKVFNGTRGDVTPRDLNVFLRSAGPMAKTLSEDGLISVATVIWEEKRSGGE